MAVRTPRNLKYYTSREEGIEFLRDLLSKVESGAPLVHIVVSVRWWDPKWKLGWKAEPRLKP